MTRDRLLACLRVGRALGRSRTAVALLGLFALLCGLLWLMSHGRLVEPDGGMDVRIWVSGQIVDIPKFKVWWIAGGLGLCLLLYGLYGRAMAKGPLLDVVSAIAPDIAATLNMVSQALQTSAMPSQEHPPVVIKSVAPNLGATMGTPPSTRKGTPGGGV